MGLAYQVHQIYTTLIISYHIVSYHIYLDCPDDDEAAQPGQQRGPPLPREASCAGGAAPAWRGGYYHAAMSRWLLSCRVLSRRAGLAGPCVGHYRAVFSRQGRWLLSCRELSRRAGSGERCAAPGAAGWCCPTLAPGVAARCAGAAIRTAGWRRSRSRVTVRSCIISAGAPWPVTHGGRWLFHSLSRPPFAVANRA